VSAAARINRTIGLLERMLRVYDLQDMNDQDFVRVQEIEGDVDELWEALDRHLWACCSLRPSRDERSQLYVPEGFESYVSHDSSVICTGR
jgi:hypothetical protein